MSDKPEISVLLTLKDQMTKAMDKAKADVLGSLKTMGVAFTAYAAGMSAALTMAVLDAQNYAVEIDRLNKTTGVSTEEISKLGYAAKQEHASMEALSTGMKFLAKNMYDAKGGTGEAAKAFEDLGIRTTDASGNLRNSGDVLLEVADKFKGMTNESEKSALAMKIFGRSGSELVPFLNMGKEEIKRLGDEAQRLGIVLSKDNVAAFKKFEDSQDAIKAGFMGMKIALANELLPVLQDLAGIFQKLIEWVVSWSDSTKTIIAVSVTLITVLSGMVGVTALIIGNLPKLAAGWKLVSAAVNSTFIAYTALVAVLAVAQKLILDYLEKQQEERLALIETGKSLQSLITLHQQELIEIKEKLKNTKLSTEERAKLELQYKRTKEAIKDTIAEIGKETKATVEQKKVVRDLDDEMAKWQNNLGDVSYEQLPDMIKALEKTNDELSEAEKRIKDNQDSLTGAGQVNKQYTDGLKIMSGELKTTKGMTEENAAAFITMAESIFNSGVNIKNTFGVMVDGISRMFDPVTGAAIQLGGSIIKKMFWGDKKKEEVIDENLKIISDYLNSIRTNWANFAVDLATVMKDSLQMPTIEEGWNNFTNKMLNNFKQKIAENLAASLLNVPQITQGVQAISTVIGAVGAPGTDINLQIDLIKNWSTQLMATVKPFFDQFKTAFGAFDIPVAAEGLTVRPRAGGTLVRVGEAGETEHIIPESKMGSGNTYVFNFSGVFAADRAAMSKLAREHLIPELIRFKMKTGEAF